jgi:chorismate mutase
VKLADIRREIDRLDQQLLQILGRRFQLVRLLGELKAGAMQVRVQSLASGKRRRARTDDRRRTRARQELKSET